MEVCSEGVKSFVTKAQARQGYALAWAGFCMSMNQDNRYKQLVVLDALKPHCATVPEGNEWRLFIATLPGYREFLKSRKVAGVDDEAEK